VLNLERPVDELPELNGYRIAKIDANTLVADVRKGQNINGLFLELSNAGISVSSMRNKANRLEQLFIARVKGNQTSDTFSQNSSEFAS
ncbi:MAG: hypothetical protein ACRERV_17570, partial [Methylococcales bacterium]